MPYRNGNHLCVDGSGWNNTPGAAGRAMHLPETWGPPTPGGLPRIPNNWTMGAQEAAYAPDVPRSVLDDNGLVPGWLDNVRTVLDLSGNGHHLVQATGANQPRFLKFDDGKHLHRPPATVTNFDFVTISSLTSDVTATRTGHAVQMCIKPSSWAPGADKYLCVRSDSSGSFYSWTLYLSSAGLLVTNLTGTIVASTAAVSFAAKQKGWVRMEYIQDTGAGQYSVIFRTSADGVTYTQLGATQTGASLANLNNTNITQISYLQGPSGVLSMQACNIYEWSLWNQAGTLVADWNAEDFDLSKSITTFPMRTYGTLSSVVTMASLCVPVDRSMLYITSATILPITNPIKPTNSYKFGMVYAGRPPSASASQYVMGMRLTSSGVTTPPYTLLTDVTNGQVFTSSDRYFVKADTASAQYNRQRFVAYMDVYGRGVISKNGVETASATIPLAIAGNLNFAYSTDVSAGVAMGRMGLWRAQVLPTTAQIEAWLDAK